MTERSTDPRRLPNPGALARLSGQWLRRPHAWEGEHLYPAAGGSSEAYDPLGRAEGADPLWQRIGNLDPTDREELAAFATAYGPLGILPHQLLEARYPVWENVAESVLAASQGEWERSDLQALREALKGGVGATTGPYVAPLDTVDPDGHTLAIERPWFASHVAAGRASLRRVTEDGAHLGRVLWLNRNGFTQERALETAYGPFFPALDGAARPYPALNSRDFWQDYAEPADLIEEAIRDFRAFARRAQRTPSLEGADLEQAIEHAVSLPWDYYLRGVHPVAVKVAVGATGSLRLGWAFPSLLAAAALSLLLWMQDPHSLTRTCAEPTCGRLFNASRRDAQYCGPRCRSNANQRNWRARKREEDGR